MGLFGFSEGGPTSGDGPDQVAGVVHGSEYVLNAAATKRIGVDTLNLSIRAGSNRHPSPCKPQCVLQRYELLSDAQLHMGASSGNPQADARPRRRSRRQSPRRLTNTGRIPSSALIINSSRRSLASWENHTLGTASGSVPRSVTSILSDRFRYRAAAPLKRLETT